MTQNEKQYYEVWYCENNNRPKFVTIILITKQAENNSNKLADKLEQVAKQKGLNVNLLEVDAI